MRKGNSTGYLILALCVALLSDISGKSPMGPVIYLFPGQGADCRQFMELDFPEGFDTVHISYPVPNKNESLPEFAWRFLPRIDTSRDVILMGVSLGGMICTELAHVVKAEEVILISSAKNRNELPRSYTFQKKVPINRVVPRGLTKAGALFLQGIVEPDRKYNKALFKDMLRRKDPLYLKRTADMIIRWDRESCVIATRHIHGNKDHTIPIKNVSTNYVIEEGSHMMVLTQAPEISAILREILSSRSREKC